MTIEECIAQAKQEIFGMSVRDPAALTALNFAKNYFEPLIIEAELVLQKICVLTQSLKICLMKAFDVYKHKSLAPFGRHLDVIQECARRFENRYAYLLNGYAKIAV
jgi:hypothetical protein